MEEADQGAREDQDAADPPWRRLVAPGFGEQRWCRMLHRNLKDKEQERRQSEAEQRREQQRFADIGRL
jgi:hypothetical protein